MKIENLSITVAIPTYNGSRWITDTLKSLLDQDFTDYQILICDDASTDNTVTVIRKYFLSCHISNSKFRIHVFLKNVGYAKNLQRIRRLVTTDLLFLLGQDDLLLPGALKKTYQAFLFSPDVGAVTRPYYWFWQKPNKPIRAVLPLNNLHDSQINIKSNTQGFFKVLESVGQLSGLAYRMKYFRNNFHDAIFPSHIYPFLEIARDHQVIYLKDFTVAVRVESSQTRFKTTIYSPSPTVTWVTMFQKIFTESRYHELKNAGIRQLATHYVGLIQIKNFGRIRDLLNEIKVLIYLRPLNLIAPKFWFYVCLTLFLPRRLLLFISDNYKAHINSRMLSLLTKKIKNESIR